MIITCNVLVVYVQFNFSKPKKMLLNETVMVFDFEIFIGNLIFIQRLGRNLITFQAISNVKKDHAGK